MNIGNSFKWFGGATLLFILGVAISCSRNIALPVNPNMANTNTPTNTNSPTNTNTPANTNTPTNTFTNTPTNTPTFTNTPVGPTNTPTNTLTFTNTFTYTLTFTKTNTPTNTLTSTPTFTPTVDPNLIDNFESGGNTVISQGGRNGLENTGSDGTGTISPAAGSFTPQNAAGQGALGSNYFAHITGGGQTIYGASFFMNFKNPQANYDTSTHTGYIFYVKMGTTAGAVSKTLFNVATQENMADSNDYHSIPICLTSTWTPVTVFYSQLHQGGWGPSGGTVAFNGVNAQQLIWSFPAGVTFDLYLDNVAFTNAADPGALPNTRVDMLRDGSMKNNPNLTGLPAKNAGWSTYIGASPTYVQPIDANVVQCGGFISPFRVRDYGHLHNTAGNYQSYTMTDRMFGINGAVTTLYNAQAWTGIKFYINNNNANPTVGTTFNNYFYLMIQETSTAADAGNCTTHCWDHPGIDIKAYKGMGWTLVQKPFSQINWANVGGGWTYAPAPASLAAYPAGLQNITNIQVANTSNGTAVEVDIDLSIDDIEFY